MAWRSLTDGSGFTLETEAFVMDEESLRKAVLEQSPEYQGVRIGKGVGIHFSDVCELSLEYKDILKIEHLWEFTSLTKLELNCNIIEKIDGLDHLKNLKWLNLSFNKIEKIAGLGSLTKLEVLNLTSNRISVIENMDTLENLSIFAIGDNRLAELGEILSLKKLKHLFTLTIKGNPFCEETDYKYLIAAHFPNLKYLDYRILTKETKKEASEKYSLAALQNPQIAEDSHKKVEPQLHKDAFVEFLDGPHLFEKMIKDDPNATELRSVPTIAGLHSTFEDQMVELCKQLFKLGMDEYLQREKEVNSFLGSHKKAVSDCQKKSSHILAQFEQQHQQRLDEMQQISDPEPLMDKVNVCNAEINGLSENLLTLQFQLISQLEDMVKKFDNSITDMVGTFTDTAQGIFVQCHALEDKFYANVREVAIETLDKVMKGDEDENMPEDTRRLFRDKDTVLNALATAHQNHLLAISDRETQLITRINAWKVDLIQEVQSKGLQLNRTGISDTNRYVEYLMERVRDLQ